MYSIFPAYENTTPCDLTYDWVFTPAEANFYAVLVQAAERAYDPKRSPLEQGLAFYQACEMIGELDQPLSYVCKQRVNDHLKARMPHLNWESASPPSPPSPPSEPPRGLIARLLRRFCGR